MKKFHNLVLIMFTILCFCGMSTQVSANVSVDGDSYIVEEDETWTSETTTHDVYIPQGVTLTTTGTTTIYGDVYVFGFLNNTGSLTVEGTLHCLKYSGFSAGSYSYGILTSSGTLKITSLNVTDDYLDVEIPVAHVHTWEEYYTEKESCFSNWTKVSYCVGCDERKTESVTPTGHDFEPWYATCNASCGSEGEMVRYCYECNYCETKIIPATENHTWTDWEIYTDPDCLNTGTEERYCMECYKSEFRTLAIEPNHHDYSRWTVSKRATALKKGTKTRYCYICDHEDTASIAKLKAKVTLKKSSITIKKKGSYTLKIKSKTYGDKIKKWATSNKNIATVTQKGKVTGKKKGTAYITLYMKSGAKVKCKVKVN